MNTGFASVESEPLSMTESDLRVQPHLRCPDDRDLGLAMGAPAACSNAVRRCCNAIILSLVVAMTTGHPMIRYSRNRNTYSLYRSKLPEWWTYGNVMRAIEHLTKSVPILIDHRAPQQSPRARGFTPRQSTLTAGPAFKPDVALDETLIAQIQPGARIRLRDAYKREKPLPAGRPIVGVTESFLRRFDEAVRNATFEIQDPRIAWMRNGTIGSMTVGHGKVCIDLGRRYLVRIFTRDMRSGGRWYQGFWAEMPSELRRMMLIDGAAVVEHDYSACHLRLAYYAAGAADALSALGKDKLYTLPGFDACWRPAVKRAVMIMLNAGNLAAARQALAREIAGAVDAALLAQRPGAVDELLAAVKAAHPAIASFWHSNCGIGLQFVDSEIVRIAIERLLDRGVLALPVHDSLLTAKQHKDLLVEVMEHAFEIDGQRIALERFAHLRGRPGQAGLRVHDLTHGRSGQKRSEKENDRVPTSDSSIAPLEASWRLLEREPAAILSDLSAILIERGAWSKPIIRAALHQLATAPVNRASLRSVFNSWQLTIRTPSPAPPAFLRAELDRFYTGSRRRPTPAAIAHHCNIQPAEAARLNLAVLRPTPRGPKRQAIAKRARRMADGVLPTIVPIQPVEPWRDTSESRSAWYARTTPAERQVLALQTLLRRGDHSALHRAATAIANAKEARQVAGPSPSADVLLAQLDAVMARVLRTHFSVTNFNIVMTSLSLVVRKRQVPALVAEP